MSWSDKIALFALFVSFVSLVAGLISIYLGKRIEIVYEKFEKLCLENVTRILSNLDLIFDERSGEQMFHFRTITTDTLVELQLFLIQLKKIYPDIELNSIIKISDAFTDSIYEEIGTQPVGNFKSAYFSAKLAILHYLYEFTINKHLSVAESLKFWKWFKF